MKKNKISLLVVEDLVFAADLNIRQIQRAGYLTEYKIVSTLAELTQVMPTTNWDLIISDHSMKTISSVDVLRLRNQLFPDTPFLIVTDSIDEHDMQHAYLLGCNQVVFKKNLQDLRRIVRVLLG